MGLIMKDKLVWKIERWVRYEFLYFHKTLYNGIKNLIIWFPIIFKDRNWDHFYMYKLIQFKLKMMSKYNSKYGNHVGDERNVERMNTCIKLIDKIINDTPYHSEYQEYYDYDIKNPERLSEYFKKYPNDYKRCTKRYKKYKNNDFITAIIMAAIREEKANKILFTILERNLQGWWN
jgi:hypothetical protein